MSGDDSIDISDLSRRIGEELREARVKEGHTQESLAAASGIARSVIAKIENGKAARLDLKTYRAITRVLSVDVRWFAGERVEVLQLKQIFSEDDKEGVLSKMVNRLQNRGSSNPVLVLVGGYAGSGKSEFGKAIASITGWPVVDKDVVARPMTEELLEALGADRNDRHSSIYVEQVRPLEYRSTMEAVFRNLECGHSSVVTAPFLKEMNDGDWTTRLGNRCSAISCDPVYVWIDCDIPTMKGHIEHRGAARDAWKLKNWETYESSIDLLMRPCVPHVVVDNSRNAALSLVAQATTLTQQVGYKGR